MSKEYPNTPEGMAKFHSETADGLEEVIAGLEASLPNSLIDSYRAAEGIHEIAQGLSGHPASAAVFMKILQAGFRHYADYNKADALYKYGKKLQSKFQKEQEHAGS